VHTLAPSGRGSRSLGERSEPRKLQGAKLGEGTRRKQRVLDFLDGIEENT
jgi:hypothetical protein